METIRYVNDVLAVAILLNVLIVALCGLSWAAVRFIHANTMEWWWMVTWAAYRTSKGGSAAKSALRNAIEEDAKNAAREAK